MNANLFVNTFQTCTYACWQIAHLQFDKLARNLSVFAMLVDALLILGQVVVFVYDMVTYPVYQILQQPWKNKNKSRSSPRYLV